MYDEKIQFLEHLLGRCRYNSNSHEAIFFCPFCAPRHHKPKLYINIQNDKYNCYVCNSSGYNLYPIIKKLGNHEDINLYNSKFKSKNVTKKENIEFDRVCLPKEFVPLCNNDSIFIKRVKNYLFSRDLEECDFIKYKIGTCVGGKYNGMVIFTSFNENGEINYFTARSVESDYKLIPATERGYKNSIIINELNIDFNKPLLIVEGPMDYIKSGIKNCVPLFGSSLNRESKLFKEIVKNDTIIYLCLDEDAKEKTLKIAKDLIGYGIIVYTINIHPYGDMGRMPKGLFKEKFYNNLILLDEMEILKQSIKIGWF